MNKTFEPGAPPEPNCEPEARTVSNDLRPTLRVKRALFVGAVLLTLMAGTAPAADAATYKGDTGVQTMRICWLSRC